MVLKSYRLTTSNRSKKKKRKVVGLLGQATGAIIGVALLSQTARAVNRI